MCFIRTLLSIWASFISSHPLTPQGHSDPIRICRNQLLYERELLFVAFSLHYLQVLEKRMGTTVDFNPIWKLSSFTASAVLLMFLIAAQRSFTRAFPKSLPSKTFVRSIVMSRAAAAVVNGETSSVMTDDQRFLFDLNGYIVVRGVLTPEEVEQANKAIDNHADQMISRGENALRNAKSGTKMYGSGPGRKDLGGVLEWGDEESRIFCSILAHPKLVPLFHGILGKGYRMDHLPFVLAQDEGAEGFSLHGGTIDCFSGEYNHHLAYTCMQGTIRSALLGCNVMLTDHNPGDGGFCVVPGSHKSNFKMPDGMVDGMKYDEFIQQPATKAGDVVLFSEGTVHGALPWTVQGRQRRACLYRFAPCTQSYGRSYFGHDNNRMGWPDAIYKNNELTDAQKAVLEAPYASRLDRPIIEDAATGTVKTSSRSQRKKQHDQEVFGTKYF